MCAYEIKQNSFGHRAIFDGKEQISNWWLWIYDYGLVEGSSEYYMVINNNGKHAIFHKDDPDTPISQWWDWINPYELARGQTEYYVAQMGNKCAIFHKDDPYNPISQWWNDIWHAGLLKGKSEYYVAKNNDNKYAIFHKNNPNEPVSLWYYSLSPIGLVNGTAQCYAVVQPNSYTVQVYHVNNMYEHLYELPQGKINLLLYIKDEYALYIYNDKLQWYDALTMETNIISPLSEEMIQLLSQGDRIDVEKTDSLLSTYLQNSFLPIVLNNQVYLYTLNGNFLGKFDSEKTATAYIKQELSKDNDYSMRLY